MNNEQLRPPEAKTYTELRRNTDTFRAWHEHFPQEFKDIKEMDVHQLNDLAKKVKQCIEKRTIRDILPYFFVYLDVINSHSDRLVHSNAQESLQEIERLFKGKEDESIVGMYKNLVSQRKNSLTKDEIRQLEIIGQDIYLADPLRWWLELFLSTETDKESQAKAIYLMYIIENPMIEVPRNAQKKVKRLYESQKENKDKDEFEVPEETQDAFLEKLGYSYTEITYSAYERSLNAWGYASTMCEVALKFIEENQRFLRDYLRFNAESNIGMFPPQLAWICEQILHMYPEIISKLEEQYTLESLDKLDEHKGQIHVQNIHDKEILTRCIQQFYADHPEGIFSYFKGKLNYSLVGINRAGENPKLLDTLPSGKTIVSVFSGPPDAALIEANETKNACVTVDQFALEELHEQAFRIGQELLPQQTLRSLLITNGQPVVNIPHHHITAKLPDDWERVRKELEGNDISLIEDKRGSLLYEKDERLLAHIHNMLLLAKSGTKIFLSKGISRWMLNDVVVEVLKNGSLRILDCISGMPIRKGIQYSDGEIFHGQTYRGKYYEDMINIRRDTGKLIFFPRARHEFFCKLIESSRLDLVVNANVIREYIKRFYQPIFKELLYFSYDLEEEYVNNMMYFGEVVAKKKLSEQAMEIARQLVSHNFYNNINVAHSELLTGKISIKVHQFFKKLGFEYRNLYTFSILNALDYATINNVLSRVFGSIFVTTAHQGVCFPSIVNYYIDPSDNEDKVDVNNTDVF